MITFNEQKQKWDFHTLEAMYTDSSKGEPKVRVEFVTNRRYLEERVRQWPHLSDLVVRPLEPNLAQQARLDDINAANVGREHELYADEYVHHGFMSVPDPENPDTGHTYLNTLAGRPENAQLRREQLIHLKQEEVAHRRWQEETKGIWVNDFYFGTTDREKALLASKVVAAMNKPGATHRYKTGQGWITLTSDLIIQLGLTVEQYVQTCFDNEGALVDQLNSADDPTTVDIESGWPDNSFTLDLTSN